MAVQESCYVNNVKILFVIIFNNETVLVLYNHLEGTLIQYSEHEQITYIYIYIEN